RGDGLGSPAVYGHQGLPSRVAHEARADEHGSVDRESRSLPRPSTRGVHGDAAEPDEAAGHTHEIHPSQGNGRYAATGNPRAAKDGIPRAGRALAAWTLPSARQ